MPKIEEVLENGYLKLLAVFFTGFSAVMVPAVADPDIHWVRSIVQAFLSGGSTVGALFMARPTFKQ